jgi:hypothetical protein
MLGEWFGQVWTGLDRLFEKSRCHRQAASNSIKDQKQENGILQTFFSSSATLQGKIFAKLLTLQS